MEKGRTQDELRQLAAKHGYAVSNVQVGRWHRFGLLPKPRLQPLGKGHGSAKAIYPPRTAAQLLHLCELRKVKHERRPHYLAWYLWWEGDDAPMPRVREFLEAVAGGLDDANAERQAQSPEEVRAMAEAEFAAEKRLPDNARILSRIRRRVGKAGFPDVVSSLALSLSGDEPDAQGIVDAFGLQFLFGTFLGQKMLSASDAQEVLEASRKALSTPQSEQLETLSDADLRRIRDQLGAALDKMQGLAVILRQVGGASAEGLIDTLLPTEASLQARFLLFLGPLLNDPAYRGPQPPEGTLTPLDLAPAFEFLGLLLHEVPVLVDYEILTPRRIKEAAHDAAVLDRLAGAIQLFAQEHPHEFDAFLADHPEARRKLYPEEDLGAPAR